MARVHDFDDDEFYYCPHAECACHDGVADDNGTGYDFDPHVVAYKRAVAWANCLFNVDKHIFDCAVDDCYCVVATRDN